MSSMTATHLQQKTANFFQLCNLSGKTKITYYHPSDGFSGATLKYEGPEGNWTFDSSEISHEVTSLGHLISVVLRTKSLTHSTFWFFLPPVVTVDREFQSFTTYGVRNGSNQMNYDVERFFGDAKLRDM